MRVLAPDLLAFPDYDGNGMFRSLGNIRANPQVGLLFIAMEEKPKRLRVSGRAEVVLDDPLIAGFEGAQALVRVTPVDIFPNCPRNIPRMQLVEESPYVRGGGWRGWSRVGRGWRALRTRCRRDGREVWGCQRFTGVSSGMEAVWNRYGSGRYDCRGGVKG